MHDLLHWDLMLSNHFAEMQSVESDLRFLELKTFCNNECAALSLTVLMELHTFHLKTLFNEYIIMP